MMTDRVLNEKEAAYFLNWSVKNLQARRFKRQPPPYFKIGKSIRYSMTDLQKFLEQNRIEPSASEMV